MKVIVIGGTGHIGTYLVPRLVMEGFDVTSISRGQSEPYQKHNAWKSVKTIALDREKEDANRTFAGKIVELKPDIVIDLVCFTLESAKQLAEALTGKVKLFLNCGTIWVHGYSLEVPTTEDQPRYPLEEYGEQKNAVENYLLNRARMENFPAAVLHPGHIVGPGWEPVNPQGNDNPQVFTTLAKGDELALPNLGLETVHHVHADDVAAGFVQAIKHSNAAIGESFHLVSEKAITLRGFADKMAQWLGKKPNLKFLPFEQWKTGVSERDAYYTYYHISHSPSCSIEKAKRLIDYKPRYTSIEAVCEAASWLIEQGVIKT